MSDTKNEQTTDHEARIAWLEKELARIVAKVDKSIGMEGLDTPTPKPVSEAAHEHA
jgi:hypothetical protein